MHLHRDGYRRLDAPDDTSHHAAYFECPVHFGSDKDALRVSTGTLDSPNELGDASIARFFDTLLEAEVSTLDDTAPLERRVRDRVSTSLSGGVPTLSEVARDLGMSGRTLQRRLAADDSYFRTLVDEARRRLALRLLRPECLAACLQTLDRPYAGRLPGRYGQRRPDRLTLARWIKTSPSTAATSR